MVRYKLTPISEFVKLDIFQEKQPDKKDGIHFYGTVHVSEN